MASVILDLAEPKSTVVPAPVADTAVSVVAKAIEPVVVTRAGPMPAVEVVTLAV